MGNWADLVKTPEAYQWSSYNYRAFGINNRLLDLDPWFNSLGTEIAECRLIYAQFIKESMEESELGQLRKIIQNGGIFSDGKFKKYIEKYHQGNTTIKRPGRPKSILTNKVASFPKIYDKLRGAEGKNRSDPNYLRPLRPPCIN